MTIVFLDSMDSYVDDESLWAQYDRMTDNGAGVIAASTSGGRFGGGCIQMTQNVLQEKLRYRLPVALSEVYMGCALKFGSWASGSRIIFNLRGTDLSINNGITIQAGAWNGLYLLQYGDAELISRTFVTPPFFFDTSRWYWVEVYYKPSTTAGLVTIWVDGNLHYQVTAANLFVTNDGGGTPVNVGAIEFGSPAGTMSIDDFYVADATTKRIGDFKVTSLFPTSDVTVGALTRNSGSSSYYTYVDDATPDGDGTTVAGYYSGAMDRYGVGDLAGTPRTIYAVGVAAQVKHDSGDRLVCRPRLWSGGQAVTGDKVKLRGSAYRAVRYCWQYDPSPNPTKHTAWTASAVNALNVGLEAF